MSTKKNSSPNLFIKKKDWYFICFFFVKMIFVFESLESISKNQILILTVLYIFLALKNSKIINFKKKNSSKDYIFYIFESKNHFLHKSQKFHHIFCCKCQVLESIQHQQTVFHLKFSSYSF